MTDSDVNDAQRVAGADEVLGPWNAAGVLAAADVHVTDRLVRMCAEPVGDLARLGAALAVRAVRLGSTCVALDRIDEVVRVHDEASPTVPGAPSVTGASVTIPSVTIPSATELLAALQESPLVSGSDAGPLRPLVVRGSADGPLLYLQKYFRQEETIRLVLDARASSAPVVDDDALAAALDEVFGPDPGGVDLQRVSAAIAATRWTTVLAGGPGTGKTYTVARILAVLRALHGADLRVGLCAPTGRAAAALQASVSAEMSAAQVSAPGSMRAVTVHSLLGWRPGSSPRFGRGRTLPHDVIVVDETSMLSMTAMSRLLEAVRPDARVVFVGDPHQLASVDAGAVLADLVERTAHEAGPDPRSDAALTAARAVWDAGAGETGLGDSEKVRLGQGVVTLRRGYRFGGGIAQVAAAVNAGDPDAVLELITDPSVADVELVDPGDLDATEDAVVEWGAAMRTAARAGDAVAALDALDAHRVLCAHREGVWGARGWSHRVAEWLGHDQDAVSWYPGQPILVTANDRQTATFNGDTGVVIADPASGPDAVSAAFRRGNQVRLLHPTQLADVIAVYAMTIHRSQGSQFDRVTVVLPPSGSQLLTRELLYTAITRARSGVRIIATADVLRSAVDRRVQRASGLRSAITLLD